MKDYKDYSLLNHNTFGMDVKAKRYVEYDSEGMDVYLPGWEGIPGLQDFDQSHLSNEPYLQSISNAFQLQSKTGYVFYTEGVTFRIPNPFVGFESTVPSARVVNARKVELPAGWSL